MSNDDKNELESPSIIEEIIPGKNNDDNNKSTSQNNYNNQQSSIENYDEEESALEVLEASEESLKNIEKNTDEASNQTHRYTEAITDTQEQTTQTTTAIAENYLEFQKQAFNSFQSAFMPYFKNVQNQIWNNQDFFKTIPEMYSRLVSNYTESIIAFSKMWNDIAFSNASVFKNALNKSNE